jgi:hypothetical protein
MMGFYDAERVGFFVQDNFDGSTVTINDQTFSSSSSLDCNPERSEFVLRVMDVRESVSRSEFQALMPWILEVATEHMFSYRGQDNFNRGKMCAVEAEYVINLIKSGGVGGLRPKETWMPRVGTDGKARKACTCAECIAWTVAQVN